MVKLDRGPALLKLVFQSEGDMEPFHRGSVNIRHLSDKEKYYAFGEEEFRQRDESMQSPRARSMLPVS